MNSRTTGIATLVLPGLMALVLFSPHGWSSGVPLPTDQDKPDTDPVELLKACKDADLVLVGKVAKVNPLGQTNSIPPSIFGNVTFKDVKPLRGLVPDAPTFAYRYREGHKKNLDLTPEALVLVAVKQKSVLVVVPATEANLAIANKALPAEKK